MSTTTAPNSRFALYAGLNLAFLLLVVVLSAMSGPQNPRLLYLILMFALCSSSVIDLDGLNGHYSLLAIFLANYFVMFGLGDLSALVNSPPTETSTAPLSETEAVILAGGLALVVAYRWMVSLAAPVQSRPPPRDWSMRAVLTLGSLMWVIGTYATYQWYVHIVTDTTNEAFRKGIESRGTYVLSAYILAQMMQPLGVLLIAYAYRTYRISFVPILVLAVVVVQVLLGFIIDQKGLAMMGGVLVIATYILLEGRVPKIWMAGAFAYVLLIYPIFVAARVEIHGTRGIARTAIVENLGKVLQTAIASRQRIATGPFREMTFLERMSLRSSVETFVEKTGKAAPFQYGYTLTPIFAAFVPRVVWSDKPDIPTGQLFNKEFHVTESDDIYLSPSQLGELYWNFGWSGILVGMAGIGGILGFIGCRANLADGRSVTRFLVTAITIKQLIVSFEGAIAPSYVVWLRSLAGIGLLHLLLAHIQVRYRPFLAPQVEDQGTFPRSSQVAKLFPNLLS